MCWSNTRRNVKKCWEALWRISRVSLRSNQKPIIQVNWINYVLQDGPDKCFKKILDNYEPLLQLWEESLKEDLDFETKSRIIGCKKQMKLFTFYFGLNLSKSLYLVTDNSSKTLQKEKMSAIGGKELAGLTIKTLKNIRNDRDFKLFYKKIERSASKIDEVSTPMLPRKRKKPNYSILQYVEGNPKPTGEAYHPENACDHFNQIYFEALDAIVNAINDRFHQPAFELFSQVEQLFLKSVKKQDVTDELKMVEKHFKKTMMINHLLQSFN